MSEQVISLTVNGRPVEARVPADRLLLDLLREDLGLKGTKRGCGTGECSACTVLLNGRAVTSCLVFAARCDGAEILTVEGLGDEGALHPLQQAFVDHSALQCGYCGPGALTTAMELLSERQGGSLSEDEVRWAISGNLCRCTGYANMIRAILRAAAAMGIAVEEGGKGQ